MTTISLKDFRIDNPLDPEKAPPTVFPDCIRRRRTERKSTMNFSTIALLTILPSIVLPYAASQTAAPTLAASALTAVPPLVPYSGQIEGRTGQTSATFLIYK